MESSFGERISHVRPAGAGAALAKSRALFQSKHPCRRRVAAGGRL